MATIVFYGKPTCGNNAKQRAILAEAGHSVVLRDLLIEPWTPEILRSFFGSRPVSEWFNPASPRVKSGEIDPRAQNIVQALTLMLADPLLIRRPLMDCNGHRMAGFDLTEVDRLVGLPPEQDLTRDMQTCKRKDGGCDAQRGMSAPEAATSSRAST